MNTPQWTVELDHTHSAFALLGVLVVAAAAGAGLYLLGVVGWALRLFGVAVRTSIRVGFLLWERLFSWASWPQFLATAVGLTAVGVLAVRALPALGLLLGLVLLFSGATTCLAFMFIDLERYEVRRGYKAVHNPLKGQEPAVHLVRYGSQVGPLLLMSAAVGTVLGFALLAEALYLTVGGAWFHAREGSTDLVFADFLAWALINLLRVVDVLNVAQAHHLLHLDYVTPSGWQAATLLTAFRMLFTVVLLQQLFASLRQGKLLAETIADFWSPHAPIHERARNALPQYGAGVVAPLLRSLRTVRTLTREQRDLLPATIAAIGPAAAKPLIRQLRDPHEEVRVLAACALAHLHETDVAPLLIDLLEGASDISRRELVEALGVLGAAGAVPARQKGRLRLRPARAAVLRWWYSHPAAQKPAADPVGQIVQALAAALADPLAGVRAEAARSLGRVGGPAAGAAPALAGMLGDPDETVCCVAAGALAEVGGDEGAAVEALAGLLARENAAVKEAAARALGALKKKAAPAAARLVPLLHDREEAVRAAAAGALAQVGPLPEEAKTLLVEGMQSKDSMVRAQTAEALAAIGPAAQDASAALVAAMGDDNDRVRARAVQALGKMGEGAAPAVAKTLVRALRDPDNWVSALAAEALGQMGDSAESSVPALVRSLRHATALVRRNAAEALCRLGPAAEGARPALEKAAADEDGGVRAQVVRALGAVAVPTRQGRKAAAEALQDPDPEVRAAGVEALGAWGEGGEAVTARLLELLHDANDQVKVKAAGVLPRLAEPTEAVIAGLCELLEKADGAAVRVHAALALGKFGSAAAAAGPALLQAVQTAEAEVRNQAIRAVAVIQPPEAAEAFLAGMKDAVADIRKTASAGWMNAAEVPDSAVAVLVQALSDPEPQVRANAANALARLEGLPAEAVPALLGCLSAGRDDVRANAAMALRGATGEAVAVQMRALLGDANVRLRLIAAGWLVAAQPEDAAARAVVEAALADESPGVRRAALGLVESLGAAAAGFAEALDRRAAVEEDERVREVLEGVRGGLAAPAVTA